MDSNLLTGQLLTRSDYDTVRGVQYWYAGTRAYT